MSVNSRVNVSAKVRGFVDLMKLRVVELLLVSTLPAMVLAEGGLPSLSLTVATLIGGTLAAGSANAFNMVIESESDKLMKRTAKRPIAMLSSLYGVESLTTVNYTITQHFNERTCVPTLIEHLQKDDIVIMDCLIFLYREISRRLLFRRFI